MNYSLFIIKPDGCAQLETDISGTSAEQALTAYLERYPSPFATPLDEGDRAFVARQSGGHTANPNGEKCLFTIGTPPAPKFGIIG